jgi:hypothetical protein
MRARARLQVDLVACRKRIKDALSQPANRFHPAQASPPLEALAFVRLKQITIGHIGVALQRQVGCLRPQALTLESLLVYSITVRIWYPGPGHTTLL